MPNQTPYTAYAYPFVLLRVNQEFADKLLGRLTNFRLEDHLTKADMAVWSFVDPDGTLIDSPEFEPDAVWGFRFGYSGDFSQLNVHKVKYYEPVYAEDGQTTLTVTTMGRVTDTMRVKSARNWGKIPSSDIAQSIAIRYGFKFKGEPSGDALPETPFIQPQDMSDFEYLHALAGAIDYEFFVDSETLYYRSREGAFNEPPRDTFYWWADGAPSLLKSFKPTIKATKPGKVKASFTGTKLGKKHGHSFVTNKTVKGKQLGTSKPTQQNAADPDDAPRSADPSSGKHIVDQSTGERKTVTRIDLESGQQSTVTEDSAASVRRTSDTHPQYVEKQAQADKRHYLDCLVHGAADFVGTPRVRAKATFNFQGMHKRLAGLWYSTEVVHHISEKGYTTEATLKRGAYNASPKDKSKGPNQANNQTSTATGSAQRKVRIQLETGERVSPSTIGFGADEGDVITASVPSG